MNEVNRASQIEPSGLNDKIDVCLDEVWNPRDFIVGNVNVMGTQNVRSRGEANSRVTHDAEGCHDHNVGGACPTESSEIFRNSGKDDSHKKS